MTQEPHGMRNEFLKAISTHKYYPPGHPNSKPMSPASRAELGRILEIYKAAGLPSQSADKFEPPSPTPNDL